MDTTTFSNIPNGAYFIFANEDEEPKSPENLDNNVWLKCSMRVIRKFGEEKKSTVRHGKYMTSVHLVAKTLDELIVSNPVSISCIKG